MTFYFIIWKSREGHYLPCTTTGHLCFYTDGEPALAEMEFFDTFEEANAWIGIGGRATNFRVGMVEV